MKIFSSAGLLVIGALAFSSCQPFFRTEVGAPAAGYDESDAYRRGFEDGSGDRLAGRAHNPHINEDSATLPSAHRKNYLWGYTDGYGNPSGARVMGSK
ncbi:hypothetical protein HNR46_002779 [Haloferula luteola]|uniref:Membrane lipoprotein n=1 Tax=Haloferula luteola TaxID=595692 RepID=A0A840V4P7_9BACT|nr:hypothetical protein [Haloferula luteola]MBB5352533.1 hypothetical protein [Haloferula luteola]